MSAKPAKSSFRHIFGAIRDPRINRTKRHLLIDILFIALCATLSGAEDFVTIAEFGRIRREWFAGMLELPNGIPSHDTFRRVFALLDPKPLGDCLIQWAEELREQASSGEEVVALDGKSLRRSFDAAAGDKGGSKAIHVVSAWAAKSRLSLGQVKTEEKSNEIAAVPELLKLIDVAGCLVTADAMNCRKTTAELITKQGGVFVLALKGNHPLLLESVRLFIEEAERSGCAGLKRTRTIETLDKDHGRIENRSCRLIGLPEGAAWAEEREAWPGLKSIGIAQSERRIVGKEAASTETRLFLTAIPAGPSGSVRRFARAVRHHWSIENSLHWTLDVCFNEDQCRVRKGNAPQNLAVLRHVALNLLKRDTTTKAGIRTRRQKAGWSDEYREHLLLI